jgi:hypothetical protein
MNKVEKACVWLCNQMGAPIVLIGAIIVQVCWMIIGELTKWDPYPFSFMLTFSNILQLILLFALACGQRQTQKHSEWRAETDHKILKGLDKLLKHHE